ncbi:polysaccharide deacetylase family protein [Pelagicoccus sp. SDUM812002]|uniref:polysaccharide deacetylase family protein n=1 Tax=Pelagicoccus sp. SDUM812002 TaxID=3041266 RepID=UPI002810046C|nr:polysaccharide deacetylase family protein [Pelagicoccus sp. SDUM812002]MDQ8185083.1 polysaccharide deacetylase family protein [Pelagicoccus sp. SDUM812002]
MTYLRPLLVLLLLTSLRAAPFMNASDSFTWPGGAGAAVCLTYDDSLPSQLDIAYPQLEAAGVKGTFFLQAKADTMEQRLEEWRQVGAAGHELASHSLYHPCRRGLPGRDWVAESRDLDHYTIERLRDELLLTNTLLQALDGNNARTFAYPCGDTAVANGQESFLPVTNELYLASRGVSSPQLSSMKELDFNNTPAFDLSHQDLKSTIAYLESCYKSGTVAIFLNHGVGGDYLVTDPQLHQELLDYLAANQDRFWVDTFKAVMTHTRQEFERLDWSVQ